MYCLTGYLISLGEQIVKLAQKGINNISIIELVSANVDGDNYLAISQDEFVNRIYELGKQGIKIESYIDSLILTENIFFDGLENVKDDENFTFKFMSETVIDLLDNELQKFNKE